MISLQKMLELKSGDVIYKCQHGKNTRLRLIGTPLVEENNLRWKGEVIDVNGDNSKAGSIVSFNVKAGTSNILFMYPYFFSGKP